MFLLLLERLSRTRGFVVSFTVDVLVVLRNSEDLDLETLVLPPEGEALSRLPLDVEVRGDEDSESSRVMSLSIKAQSSSY